MGEPSDRAEMASVGHESRERGESDRDTIRRLQEQDEADRDTIRGLQEQGEADRDTIRGLQEQGETDRETIAEEHRIAARLQRAMLPARIPSTRFRVATRYLSAGPLQVCGDWYDVVALPGDRLCVSIGDVVGRGLAAACVMGHLRSALSALTLGVAGPSRALEVLDEFARTIDGAFATTALQAVVDVAGQQITYSSAGHLPAMVVRPDGTVDVLENATDVALGVWPEPVDRSEAAARCATGCTLVAYTDGLVERRGEDIDVGITRLAVSLARHADLDPEPLADAVLADLTVGHIAEDDTALVVVRI